MKSSILSVCALTVLSGTAAADITVYTDRTLWEEAITGLILTEDFNAQAPGVIADGATLDTGLLQITRDGSPNGGDGLLEIEPGSNFGNLDGTTFLSGETGAAPHEIVDFNFNGLPVSAFGADFFSPFSGDGLAIQAGNTVILLDSIAGFDSGFVGFVDDMNGYTTVSLIGNPADVTFQELWSADNVSYSIVPAPASAALLALGALATTRRRR